MNPIDLHKLADEARFSAFHVKVLLWCALIIIFDGYDLAVAGIALPSIMKEMGVSPTNAGFMVSSALFGMMFGAIFLGTIADRIGRRRAIAICVALFSVFTAAAGLTNDPVTFSVMRFLAGLGIGGVMPNVVAQMTEYSPRRLRSTLVTLMFSGYAVGGMLAALLGKGLIEAWGWQSVFLAAGLPVVLIPLILKSMPESMPYLVKANRFDELRALVARLDPASAGHGKRFVLPSEDKTDKAPIGRLFQEGRGFSTVMFWVAFFMCLFMVYALSSWLAKLMAGAGYSLGSALTFVLVLNFGGMLGAVGGGWLADRFNIKWVLVGMYLLAAVSISLLGAGGLSTAVLFVVVGLAGASTIGTQIVTYAYVGQFYPMAMRSTGIGWASGVGRSGAIVAPIVIGVLVGMALPLQLNFVAIAVPAVIAAVAVSLIGERRRAPVAALQASAV